MKRIQNILSLILVLTMLALTSCTAQFITGTAGNAFVYDGLTVHFIDVGQGDCTLLVCNGEYMLIDAGEREYGNHVVDYLKAQGAGRLRYVIATHPHSDHVGGLAEVLRDIPCDTFITVETDQTSRTWTEVLCEADEADVEYIDAEVGDVYTLGAGAFTILAPASDDYEGYNNYSVVTRFVYGKTSFLFTGDAERRSENEMLASGLTLSSDVLKCGHHGSSTSSSAKFLKAVRPTSAVISCGVDNEYGHPHKETLEKLALLGTAVYRTDQQGTIVARSDGKTITFFPKAVNQPTAAGTLADENFVGNRKSMVFHDPSCGATDTMKEANKVYFATREEALKAGYSPCSNCSP